MEAIIGAIFLDNGLNSAEKFVFDSWRELLKESTAIPMLTQKQNYRNTA